MDIILLIFLAIRIGRLAEKKGKPAGKWRLNLVLAWIIGEIIGATIGIAIFGQENMFSWALIGLGCAVSTYFLINNHLTKMPDSVNEDDINNIGM